MFYESHHFKYQLHLLEQNSYRKLPNLLFPFFSNLTAFCSCFKISATAGSQQQCSQQSIPATLTQKIQRVQKHEPSTEMPSKNLSSFCLSKSQVVCIMCQTLTSLYGQNTAGTHTHFATGILSSTPVSKSKLNTLQEG